MNVFGPTKKQGEFANFLRKDLGVYPKFLEVVTQFRDFYQLGSFNFKSIDKFLWLQGKKPISAT